MTNVEGRVIRLELLLKKAEAELRSANTRMKSLETQARQPLAMMWNGGGGGQGGRPGKVTVGGITAASGDTPGTGTVTVWEYDGTSMVSTAADIDVLNLDTAISAGKYAWIEFAPDGYWYVAPLQCE